MSRPSRRPRTDRLTTMWLLAALTAAVVSIATRDLLPHTWWTTIHLVTLGVLTNGILQWSWYFARGLLRLEPHSKRAGRDAVIRSVTFNVALAGLVAAMWAGASFVTVALATAIGLVVAWHGIAILLAAREALGSRHAPLVRYYVAASALFVVGCALAGMLTVALLDPNAPAWLLAARHQLTLAHGLVMVAGWIGLSIAGTIVTLGPTVLRTRMEPDSSSVAVRGLPWLFVAVLVAGASAGLGWMAVAGTFFTLYCLGLLLWVGLPLARVALAKGLREHAGWTLMGGVVWSGVGLVVTSVVILRAPDATVARDAIMAWIPVLGIAGPGQIFIGALTYLLPVVVGGGPSTVRLGIATLETASALRLTVRTAALALLALTTGVGSPARWAWWALVAATFVADVVLMAVAGVRQARVRKAPGGAVPLAGPDLGLRPPAPEPPSQAPGSTRDMRSL